MLLTRKKGKIANIILQALQFIKLVLFIFVASCQIKTNWFEAAVTFFRPQSCRAKPSFCGESSDAFRHSGAHCWERDQQCYGPYFFRCFDPCCTLCTQIAVAPSRLKELSSQNQKQSFQNALLVFWTKFCFLANVSSLRCLLLLPLELLKAKENLGKNKKLGITLQCSS